MQNQLGFSSLSMTEYSTHVIIYKLKKKKKKLSSSDTSDLQSEETKKTKEKNKNGEIQHLFTHSLSL
jgi:hypothetical protein